jgi:hypothetical protein
MTSLPFDLGNMLDIEQLCKLVLGAKYERMMLPYESNRN